MSYFIAAISNGGGAPEQAYRKMQAAGACPEKPFAGELNEVHHGLLEAPHFDGEGVRLFFYGPTI